MQTATGMKATKKETLETGQKSYLTFFGKTSENLQLLPSPSKSLFTPVLSLAHL